VSEPVTYQRIQLAFESPWNLGAETTQNWNQKFHLSGTIALNQTEAEATAIELASVALALASSSTSLVKAAYYPQGSHVNTWEAIYAPGTHPGTNAAYAATPSAWNQLEVAVVARVQVGKNSRGKPVFLRKWFHNVANDATNPNAHPPLFNTSTLLEPFNVGAGPNNVRPVRPTDGVMGGVWEIESHLFTHQVRRGHKKKKVSAAGLLDYLGQLAQDAANAKVILDALPK
jgi:hypothetical protein